MAKMVEIEATDLEIFYNIVIKKQTFLFNRTSILTRRVKTKFKVYGFQKKKGVG